MEMFFDKIFDKNVTEPVCVHTQEEFVLYIHAILMAIVDPDDEIAAMEFVKHTKVLLHEYLAGVLNGTIQPYVIDNFTEETVDGFKEMISEMRQQMAMNNIPMKENDKGGLEIDFDTVAEKVKEDDSNIDEKVN